MRIDALAMVQEAMHVSKELGAFGALRVEVVEGGQRFITSARPEPMRERHIDRLLDRPTHQHGLDLCVAVSLCPP